MRTIHWECKCGTSGTVQFQDWDFKTVAGEIVAQHAKVTPWGPGWSIPELVGWSHANLDLEVSEDLTEARLRHIQ